MLEFIQIVEELDPVFKEKNKAARENAAPETVVSPFRPASASESKSKSVTLAVSDPENASSSQPTPIKGGSVSSVSSPRPSMTGSYAGFAKARRGSAIPIPGRGDRSSHGSNYSSFDAPSVATSAANAGAVAASVVGTADGVIEMEGTLFKQRDVFKGWRPRHFVLQDGFLHYYLEESDPVPFKSMNVLGTTLTELRPSQIGEALFHPFLISHSKSPKTYNLAADTKEKAQEWIKKIRAASAVEPAALPGLVDFHLLFT
jgi:hypothetical protein